MAEATRLSCSRNDNLDLRLAISGIVSGCSQSGVEEPDHPDRARKPRPMPAGMTEL